MAGLTVPAGLLGLPLMMLLVSPSPISIRVPLPAVAPKASTLLLAQVEEVLIGWLLAHI